MKQLLVTLLTATVLFAVEFTGYSNFELDNIDFSDTLMISSVYRLRGLPDGWVQGGNPEYDSLADSIETIPYAYEYDSINNWITIAPSDTFFLDTQKRVVKIKKSDIRTTHITYGTNSRTIIEHPNVDTLNNYSKKWHYTYTDDGQILEVVKTPVDWTWEPSGQAFFWNTTAADTLTYTYDGQGRKASGFRSYWTNNFAHSVPWKSAVDSFNYTYSSIGDTTVQVIILLSKVDDSTWAIQEEDSLWQIKYDVDGKILTEEIYRWDRMSAAWDSTYYQVISYTYEDDRIKTRTDNLYYGNGGGSILTKWHEEFTYDSNTLVYGVPTPLTTGASPISKVTLRFASQGSQRVALHGSRAGYDKITILDIAGRKIREVSHSNSISTTGISTGQLLLFVATKQGVAVHASKLLIR